MKITILLFDGITILDAVGAYDPLARVPGTEFVFATESGGMCRTGEGSLSLVPSTAIGTVERSDILLIPGGSRDGLRRCIGSPALLADIARLDGTTTITASVCTGALILGAAGLLQGRDAATNWRARDQLARFGARYTGERVTRDGKYWTAAGVTAAIDLGIALSADIAGDAIAAAVEQAMEYAPRPPFGTGDPAMGTAERRRIVEEVLRG